MLHSCLDSLKELCPPLNLIPNKWSAKPPYIHFKRQLTPPLYKIRRNITHPLVQTQSIILIRQNHFRFARNPIIGLMFNKYVETSFSAGGA